MKNSARCSAEELVEIACNMRALGCDVPSIDIDIKEPRLCFKYRDRCVLNRWYYTNEALDVLMGMAMACSTTSRIVFEWLQSNNISYSTSFSMSHPIYALQHPEHERRGVRMVAVEDAAKLIRDASHTLGNPTDGAAGLQSVHTFSVNDYAERKVSTTYPTQHVSLGVHHVQVQREKFKTAQEGRIVWGFRIPTDIIIVAEA